MRNTGIMEKIKLDKDIKVFYLTATSFPEGIDEAHQQLRRLTTSNEDRRYYGLSRPENANYDIVYKAAAEELNNGEAEKLNCQLLLIKKGTYISIIVNNYKKDPMAIDKAFKQLLSQPELDPEGYCVEYYFSNGEDVQCMIRLEEK